MTDQADTPAVIYGGSFDPPHHGHKACLQQALAELPGAKPYVIPAFKPPVRSGQVKQTTASFKQRLAMCQLAFQDLIQSCGLVVDEIESRLPSPSYSLQTIQAMQKMRQHRVWYLLIGGDQLENLGNWYQVDQLLALANLIVVPREPIKAAMLHEALMQLAEQLGWKLQQVSEHQYAWEVGTQVKLCQDTVSPAASSIFRKDSGGKETWLDQKVMSYIQEHQLYNKAQPQPK